MSEDTQPIEQTESSAPAEIKPDLSHYEDISDIYARVEPHNTELADEFRKAAEEANKPAESEKSTEEAAKEPKYSEVELKAIENGWDPTGAAAKKAGKRVISAEEFIDRGSLFDRIESKNKQIDQMERMIKKLGDHLTKTQETAYTKALADLNNQRTNLIARGDVQSVSQVEQEMIKTNTEFQQVRYNPETSPEPIQAQPQQGRGQPKPPSDEANQFYQRNKFWFNMDNADNIKMVNYAMATDELVAARMPHITEKERLRIVEADLQKTFPDKFNNQRQRDPSAVATKTERIGSNAHRESSLNPQQKRLGRQMIEMGLYKNLDEYEKDLNR